jgi:hypothetical protein
VKRLGSILGAGLLLAGTAAIGGPFGEAGPDYQPHDRDERGLWMQMDEAERDLETSAYVIRDPALNAYVRGVFCRTVTQANCAPVRIYIERMPHFNASMAPNGMMVVWSGLLLRTRNEAQLAAILGHEYTHYRRRHSLQLWRDAKANGGAAMFLAMTGYGVLLALPMLAQVSVFSRENESEADAGGLSLMAATGYDPKAAVAIWGQLRAEQEATAAVRGGKPRYGNRSLFSSHPNSLERMQALTAQAAAIPSAGKTLGEADYRQALAPWWPQFLDDEIKLNDFGGAEFLLGQLAADGWTSDLLYARGELYRSRGRPEDLAAAVGFYRQATQGGDPPAEAWRGLGLVLLRQGDAVSARAALATYLQRRPDASDKAMITMLMGEQS